MLNRIAIEKRFASNGDDGRLIERQLLGRASVESERRTNVQRSMPHRPLYSRDHGPVIPSEVACRVVALCEGREESLTFLTADYADFCF